MSAQALAQHRDRCDMKQKQERVTVPVSDNAQTELGSIIISVRGYSDRGWHVTVGFPGMPNSAATLHIGDFILYETLEGILEIRLLSANPANGRFLLTQITPRLGIRASAIEGDPYNGPFTQSELAQVADSIEKIKTESASQRGLLSEQSRLLNLKLDEIADAAQRMGRKDWKVYVIGSLTGFLTSAAFAPDVTMSILAAVNSEFAWLFTRGMLLLENF
jgi:hypothetical protein